MLDRIFGTKTGLVGLMVFIVGFMCGGMYFVGCGQDSVSSAAETRVVKANGENVGRFVSLSISMQHSIAAFVTETSTNYLLPINRDGTVDGCSLYYASADCSGDAYAYYGVAKAVFRNGSSLYYLPSTTGTGTSLSYQSYRAVNTGSCSESTGTGSNMIVALPNDVTVTGASTASFTPPITIE